MKNKNQVVANWHFCYTFTLVVSYILSQHAYRAFLIELKPGGKKKRRICTWSYTTVKCNPKWFYIITEEMLLLWAFTLAFSF